MPIGKEWLCGIVQGVHCRDRSGNRLRNMREHIAGHVKLGCHGA